MLHCWQFSELMCVAFQNLDPGCWWQDFAATWSQYFWLFCRRMISQIHLKCISIKCGGRQMAMIACVSTCICYPLPPWIRVQDLTLISHLFILIIHGLTFLFKCERPRFLSTPKRWHFLAGISFSCARRWEGLFHNICAGELHERAGKIHPRQDYKSPGFLCAAKNCVDVSEAEICKICAEGKKGENVGFEICKTWEGTGRTFDPNISAGQPDLSLETLVQQQCPFQ